MREMSPPVPEAHWLMDNGECCQGQGQGSCIQQYNQLQGQGQLVKRVRISYMVAKRQPPYNSAMSLFSDYMPFTAVFKFTVYFFCTQVPVTHWALMTAHMSMSMVLYVTHGDWHYHQKHRLLSGMHIWHPASLNYSASPPSFMNTVHHDILATTWKCSYNKTNRGEGSYFASCFILITVQFLM